jgi:hypothetical protein
VFKKIFGGTIMKLLDKLFKNNKKEAKRAMKELMIEQ